MTNEDFCSYEIAVQLKKLGFDYPCHFYYTKKDAPEECVWHTTSEEAPIDYNRSVYAECSMPTLAQVQKWLISKGIFVEITSYGKKKRNCMSDIWVVDWGYELRDINTACYLTDNDDSFESYSACLESGIEAALELITDKTE